MNVRQPSPGTWAHRLAGQPLVVASPAAVFRAALDQLQQFQRAHMAPRALPTALPAASPQPVSWQSNLYPAPQGAGTGQMPTGALANLAYTIAVAGTALGAYHGYRRTSSLGWTLVWALAGGAFPYVTLPVAYAQGFGQKAR